MSQASKLFAMVFVLSLAAMGAEFPTAPQPRNTVVATTLPAMVQPVIAVPLKSRPVSTKPFWALTALNSALTVADIELTQNCLATIPGCQEVNPLYGPHPSRMRMYATNIPITAGINFLSYHVLTAKYKTKLWVIPQATLAGSHFAGVMTNIAVRTR